MTKDEQHVKIVRDLYAATGSANWALAESMLTEDFFITEAQTMPFAGVYRGRNALQQLFQIVMPMVDVIDLVIQEITVGGDYGVCLLDMVLAGNPPVRAPIAEMFRFRDGKVCEIKPYYFDPTLIVNAANAKRRATAAKT
jgi:ketosteroid isomerase-like protein